MPRSSTSTVHGCAERLPGPPLALEQSGDDRVALGQISLREPMQEPQDACGPELGQDDAQLVSYGLGAQRRREGLQVA
jgi:hypothetical protein